MALKGGGCPQKKEGKEGVRRNSEIKKKVERSFHKLIRNSALFTKYEHLFYARVILHNP